MIKYESKYSIKIALGIITILLGLGINIISFKTSSGIAMHIIPIGIIIAGLRLLVIGFNEKKKSNIYEKNKSIYGVEEPDKKWECPRCNTLNSNIAYICKKCKYKII